VSLLLLQLPLAQACCAAGCPQGRSRAAHGPRSGVGEQREREGLRGDPPGKAAGPACSGSPRASSRGAEGAWSEAGGEGSEEAGAVSVGRSAVPGSGGWAARGGSCAVSPGRDSQGVTVRPCLVVEEAAVLGGGGPRLGVWVCLEWQKEPVAPLVLNFVGEEEEAAL